MDEIKEKIQKIQGFKILKSHFRLGSKIHISDFYYAKRFFQNSFFSSRFAFIITKNIIDNHESILIENEGLTLIGYGLYSELLVSMVKNYLKKYFKNSENIKLKLNHDLFSDSEDLNLIKGYDDMYDNISIIVPIASTFSTSMKIEEKLRTTYGKKNILSPHLNVLLISDGEINRTLPNDTEKKFGWKEINQSQKTVTVSNSFGEQEKKETQKFFLSLPSKWYVIEGCEICFPDISSKTNDCIKNNCDDCHDRKKPGCPLSEKVLQMTDKTSVTPSIIFSYPKCRIITQKEKETLFSINNNTLKYGHVKRGNNHYHFYLHIEKLFQDNKDSIEKWLQNSVKKDLATNIQYSAADKVLIIAPEHFSNTDFINTVNEELFSNSANILHYNAANDHIANFQSFFGSEINQAEKIFFVDDTITTGSTFFKTNYFIKHTRGSIDGKDPHGFDACIFLLNRSDSFTQKNILRKLNNDSERVYSYANIHLPPLKGANSDCKLCIDRKRAESLIDDSFLDRLKMHFYNRIKRLTVREIRSFSDESNQSNFGYNILKRQIEDLLKTDKLTYEQLTLRMENIHEKNSIQPFENKNKNLIKIEAIHRIFEYFSSKDRSAFFSNETTDFISWQKDLRSCEKSPFERNYLLNTTPKDLLPLTPDSAILLKVLTFPPLNAYKPIREKSFEWIIELFNRQIEVLKEQIDNKEYNYKAIRDFKFLIRRAGLMNANFLISKRFLDFLKILYTSEYFEKLLEEFQGIIKQAVKEINQLEQSQKDILSLRTYDIDLHQQVKIISQGFSVIDNIDDFNVYVGAQIKELLYLNASRSIILEKRIIKTLSGDTVSTGDIHPPPTFSQLFRILREENVTLIKLFWDYFKKKFSPVTTKITHWNSDFIQKRVTYLARSNHYRYKSLNDFFTAAQEDKPEKNLSFQKYLTIKAFIENQEDFDNSLREKTHFICEQLKDIIFGDGRDIDCGGIFLLVKYKSGVTHINRKNLFLAYNSGVSESEIESYWDAHQGNYILNFVEGKNKKHNKLSITIDELKKNEHGTWDSVYSDLSKPAEIKFLSDLPGIEHLLLLRFSILSLDKKNDVKDDPQGIIVFYSKESIFPIKKTRYLLLLRDSISHFIQTHHNNDEFRDWKEAYEDLRLVNLAGHSREMLMDVAKQKVRYKSIVLNMEHLQTIMKLNTVRENLRDDFNSYENFKKFYQFNGLEIIDSAYFESLKDMACDIYSYNEIENTIPCDISLIEPTENIEYHFSKQIIDIICFELFVNAKKNRWHFSAGEEKMLFGYKINKVWITHSISEDKLIIKIENTGPEVGADTISELKESPNIKGKNKISGIALIKALLKNFKLGEIDFSEEPIYNKLYKFIVTLSLKMDYHG
ncbi:hypothetical protein [Desulfobacula sp.]|uniref:hypothetical protein n=1 Tax=Desulfobacula sp. TaxID=2593537 RepID=UPI0025BA1ED5|nr:hypothetical protein [Desulfobacula sp.]MBC2705144.1 hypothetical protein [Desulfobacula sp.]